MRRWAPLKWTIYLISLGATQIKPNQRNMPNECSYRLKCFDTKGSSAQNYSEWAVKRSVEAKLCCSLSGPASSQWSRSVTHPTAALSRIFTYWWTATTNIGGQLPPTLVDCYHGGSKASIDWWIYHQHQWTAYTNICGQSPSILVARYCQYLKTATTSIFGQLTLALVDSYQQYWNFTTTSINRNLPQA